MERGLHDLRISGLPERSACMVRIRPGKVILRPAIGRFKLALKHSS